jgi:hypothetical protein
MMRHGLLLGLCFAVTAVPRVQAVLPPCQSELGNSPVSAVANTNLDELLDDWSENVPCEGVITFTVPNVVYLVATRDHYSMNGDNWTLDATGTS